MKLVTEEMRRTIPGEREQDDLGLDAIIHAKFFTPDSDWTWYVTEMWGVSGEVLFFGIADCAHLFAEYGSFSLSELEKIRGGFGLPVQRDLHWRAKTVREVVPALQGQVLVRVEEGSVSPAPAGQPSGTEAAFPIGRKSP